MEFVSNQDVADHHNFNGCGIAFDIEFSLSLQVSLEMFTTFAEVLVLGC